MTTQPTPGREQKSREFDITFPADAKLISGVVDQVVEFARRAAGDSGKEDADMEIALALTEALANAVRHGSKNDSSKNVVCRASVNGSGEVTIVVRDSGPGFDPERVADPTHGEGLGLDHGRGIFLIRELMDEYRYEHHGTELHMKKKV